MYEGNLKADEDVKQRLMIDIYKDHTDELLNNPLLLIDTVGALM